MKNIWPMAVVALLMLSAAACKKEESKAERLAALDNAYQAGVLSKAEYDAKRLALVGPPPAPPAAPVTPAAGANPVAPPQNAPAAGPPAPAAAEGAPPTPAPAPPKPSPYKRASGATPSEAMPPERTVAPPQAGQAAPITPPPAARTAPTPPPQPRPAPKRNGAEAETEPLAGCEDAEYNSGKVKGARQRFYPAPPRAVMAAARAALRSLDFIIHEDTGNDIEASKRRHIGAIVGAGGERLILHFEKAQQDGQAGTLATGETKKSFVGRVAQKSWTNAVLAQIACHLRERR